MKTVRKIFLRLSICLAVAAPVLAVEVKTIASSDGLPQKLTSLARPGDIFIGGGKNLALIGASDRRLENNLHFPVASALGTLIGFAPAGNSAPGDVRFGAAVLRIKGKTVPMPFSSVKQKKKIFGWGHVVFEAEGTYEDKEGREASVKTIYDFSPDAGVVAIDSTITNTGKTAFSELGYSIVADASNSVSFNPYHEEKFPHLNFRVNQKNGHSLGWINLNPPAKSGTGLPGKLAPGKKFRLQYLLLADASEEKLLGEIYRRLGVKTEPVRIAFKNFRGDLLEISIQSISSGTTFYRAFKNKAVSLRIPLPEGAYRLRAHLFPAVVEETIEVRHGQENALTVQAPDLTKLSLKIRNGRGEFVPGKVTIIGLDPTKSPYFKLNDPTKSGRNFEKFKNSCTPPEDGMDIEIPTGAYLVFAARGPEYSIDKKIIELLKGGNQELRFTIDKAVETKGLVSLDPHMHTQNSDGYVTISERLKSVVAEGVDAAISADHNYVTDYSPELKKLGLTPYLGVLPGSEVTVNGMIHYVTYPMRLHPEENNKGAITPLADRPGDLFKASREKNSQALLQVNHPRAGDLGYFNNYQLDQESAASALTDFDLSFDLLEVMNGVYPYSANDVAVNDWLHLLNRGIFFPAVGSSDVHGIDREEPGYSRTYVAYTGGKGEHLDWTALLQAVRKGRSFVSNGPLIEFRVNDSYSPGDTLTQKSGEIKVKIKVWSAPWIGVQDVRLIVNGDRKLTFPVKSAEGAVVKFDQTVSLDLKNDASLIVEAVGRIPLYPVHQEQQRSGKLKDAAVPYALTNPVFVDVDGNGKFDPPLPEKIKLVLEIKGKKNVVSRY